MNEQVVDLRSAWATLRRRVLTLVLAAVVGAALGAGLLVLSPPQYSSTGIVLLPGSAASDPEGSTTYHAETQVLIAESAQVLGRAGSRVSPPLTSDQVDDLVTVSAPGASVLRFVARGRTARSAQALSSALAKAYVQYLAEANSALSTDRRRALQERRTALTESLEALNDELRKTSERLEDEGSQSRAGRADAAAAAELTAQRASTVLQLDDLEKQLAAAGGATGTGSDALAGAATVVQESSPAERSDAVSRALLFVLGGACVAVLLTAGTLVVTTRHDRRLRSRDEIADAVGIPVVASVAGGAARSTVGWTDLLHSYAPDNLHGWALRQLLRRIMSSPTPDDTPSRQRTPRVVVVLCLSDDPDAVAVAPQLASFAASTGIDTALVVAQFHESASALWAACSRPADEEPLRRGLTVTTRHAEPVAAELAVRLCVLDRDEPHPDPEETGSGLALLAVSSGAATAAKLAEVMVRADSTGCSVEGVVVSAPDPLDRTTGRLLPWEPRRDVEPVAPVAEVTPRATSGRNASTRGSATSRGRGRR